MSIKQRIYTDYLAPDRFDEYSSLIELSLEQGFNHHTIYQFFNRLQHKDLRNEDKIFVHRHDIDTDPKGARTFFRAEKKFGIHATYYFRLKTIDTDFMHEIHEYGSEVGYHFEEIATFAKRHSVTSRYAIEAHRRAIESEFIENFSNFEEKLGAKVKTVSSHGDFANRKLGIANWHLLRNNTLREELGIECETYDESFMSAFDIYISYAPPPKFYAAKLPFDEIKTSNKICMLTHPRQWRASFISNTKENLIRLIEEISWEVAKNFKSKRGCQK